MIKRTYGAIAKKNVLFSKRYWHHFSSEEIRSKSVTMHYCKRSVNLYCSSIVLVKSLVDVDQMVASDAKLAQNMKKGSLSELYENQFEPLFLAPIDYLFLCAIKKK